MLKEKNKIKQLISYITFCDHFSILSILQIFIILFILLISHITTDYLTIIINKMIIFQYGPITFFYQLII